MFFVIVKSNTCYKYKRALKMYSFCSMPTLTQNEPRAAEV